MSREAHSSRLTSLTAATAFPEVVTAPHADRGRAVALIFGEGLLRRRRRLGSRRVGLIIVFLLASLFYAWTAASAGDRSQFSGFPAYYAELTTGFLRGELSIPTLPPKALLDSPDPYSPAVNHPYQPRFGDLSLYHGHFYLDWGPAPILTLYLPWRLVGLGSPSGNLAVFVYSVAGLAGALALLDTAARRFAPRAGVLSTTLAAAPVAFSGGLAFLNRQPDTYEVAVACAYAFTMLGGYILLSAWLSDRRRPRRLAGASACFGLAVAARQDLVVLALPLVVLGASVLLQERSAKNLRARPDRMRRLVGLQAGLFGPFVVIVALLGVYNFARFGSFTEIGASYQLTGVDPRLTPHYQLAYVFPSLYFYVLSPLHFSAAFPYVTIPPPTAPFALPAHYTGSLRAGLIGEVPVVLALPVAALFLRGRVPKLFATCLVFLATAVAVLLMISFAIPGGEERYEVDFLSLVLIPAVVSWLAWRPRPRIGRVVVRALGTVLILYGVVVGVALSITGYNDQLPTTQPAIYKHLVSASAGVGDLIAKILGHPVLTALNHTAGVTISPVWHSWGVGTVDYLNLSASPAALEIVVPSTGNYELNMSVGPGPDLAAAAGRQITLVLNGPTGVERFAYVNGTVHLPIRLLGGGDTIELSVAVGGVHFNPSAAVLSSSGLTVTDH